MEYMLVHPLQKLVIAMGEHFTIFGARGYIGEALVQHLRKQGHQVQAITRDNWPEKGSQLGHVVYAAGMAANYRQNLTGTLQSQTILPTKLIEEMDFSSFLYLSSTRLYGGASSTEEDAKLQVCPQNAEDIYNLTKATSECYLLAQDNPKIRVARLSNVYGQFKNTNSFLAAILWSAAQEGEVVFETDAASSKDYIPLDECLDRLAKIALTAEHRIYNVARGERVSHDQIARKLSDLGIAARFQKNAPLQSFPEINTAKMDAEFGAIKSNLIEKLPMLLEEIKAKANQ